MNALARWLDDADMALFVVCYGVAPFFVMATLTVIIAIAS